MIIDVYPINLLIFARSHKRAATRKRQALLSNRESMKDPITSQSPSGAYQKSSSILFVVILIIAVLLRLGLLLTSESMPDGDEAVTGIMAMDVLNKGVHPIYPYGVHYGAGAGIEVHLSAFFFYFFGISDFNLKLAGFVIWLLSCVVLYLLAKQKFGNKIAATTVMLYVMCPPLVSFSLKVAGGHLVAVSVGLLALLLVEHARFRAVGLALLPVTVYLHPITVPFAGGVFFYGLYREWKSDRRFLSLGAIFLVACLVAYLLLNPESKGVYHPESTHLLPGAALNAVIKVLPLLFSSNISSSSVPGIPHFILMLIWTIFAMAALVYAIQHRMIGLISLMACCCGVVLFVNPALFIQRHLLALYPLICMTIAVWLRSVRWNRFALGVLSVLLASMIITVVLDMKSSYTYGAGSQAAGINREDFRSAMKILTDNDIHYVYCLDAMLQWNIIFASRETIIARWRKTDDRVPRYIIEVDQALEKGYPVAIMYKKRPSPTDPPHINVVLNPDRDLITKNFELTTN